MAHAELVERVRERLGLDSGDEARAVVDTTLRALGGSVAAGERPGVLDALPADIAGPMRGLAPGTVPSAEALEELVAEVTRARGRALEAAECVCAALVEQLPGEQTERLRRHVAPELAAWFAPPERAEPPPRPPRRTKRRTLAEGRPGARRRSVGEAHPTGQSGSVAREREPHADRKLSSARDASDHGRGGTLATGRPGSERPIGEG